MSTYLCFSCASDGSTGSYWRGKALLDKYLPALALLYLVPYIDHPFDGSDEATYHKLTEYFQHSIKNNSTFICHANQPFQSDQAIIELCGDFYMGTIDEKWIDPVLKQFAVNEAGEYLKQGKRELKRHRRQLSQFEKMRSDINADFGKMIGYEMQCSVQPLVTDIEALVSAIDAKIAKLKKMRNKIELKNMLKRRY